MNTLCRTLLLIAALPLSATAQTNTVRNSPGDFQLSDFAWMSGEWIGSLPGGFDTELYMSSNAAGVLAGISRIKKDDKLIVLEMLTFSHDSNGVRMYLRHFDARLASDNKIDVVAATKREDIADGVRWTFESLEPGKLTIVYTHRRDGVWHSRSSWPGKDGTVTGVENTYRRVAQR